MGKTEQPILASWIRPGNATYLSGNFAKLTDDEENYYMYCTVVQFRLTFIDRDKAILLCKTQIARVAVTTDFVKYYKGEYCFRV